MEMFTRFIVDNNIILLGIAATIGTGLATGVGALPVLFTRNVSDRLLDGMLGFGMNMTRVRELLQKGGYLDKG